MAKNTKIGFWDYKKGLARLADNAAEAGKDVPLGVAKELTAVLAYGYRELTGVKKRKGPYKSNVAKKWFD